MIDHYSMRYIIFITTNEECYKINKNWVMYEGLFRPYGWHYGGEEDRYAALNSQDGNAGQDERMRLPMTGEVSISGWNEPNAQSSAPDRIKGLKERYLIRQRLHPPAWEIGSQPVRRLHSIWHRAHPRSCRCI